MKRGSRNRSFLIFREPVEKASSVVSAYKENISDNCPPHLESNLILKRSRSALGTKDNTRDKRSPLHNKNITANNLQQNLAVSSVVKDNKELNPYHNDIKTAKYDAKDEHREERQYIKGKKCIKCGYSSVKVSKSNLTH